MGIIDKVTALLPARGGQSDRAGAAFDALGLRDDLDRWVQRFFDEPWGLDVAKFPGMPVPEVRETENELIVQLEVPGLDRDDLDLEIAPNGLTIRGERREEKRDRRNDALVSEVRYGRFVETVPLPPGVDLERAEARVERGVLTVKFPKTESRPGTRRIPVTTS
jgi:HSP20 family protein